MNHLGAFLIIVALCGTGCLLTPTAVAQDTEEGMIREHHYNEQLANDTYQTYALSSFVQRMETIKFSVDINGHAPFDLYILVEEELERYRQNRSFEPEWVIENEYGAHGSWERPEWDRYYLVIDNRDNLREGDAVPNGTLTYDLHLEYPWERTIRDIFNGHIGWEFIFGLIAGMLYVAGIVYVYLDVERYRRDPVPWVAVALLCWPVALLAWRLLGLTQKPPPLDDDGSQ